MDIRTNLYSALLYLGSNGYNKLWIDALCINQEDLVERAEQIPRMKSIYHKAFGVLTWLGDENKNAQAAMSLVEKLATRTVGIGSKTLLNDLLHQIFDASMGLDDWRPLEALFQRDYWSRVWIIQELAVGRQRLIVWGRSAATWDHLRESIIAFCDYLHSFSGENTTGRSAASAGEQGERRERLIRGSDQSRTSAGSSLTHQLSTEAEPTVEYLERLLIKCGRIIRLDQFCSDTASGTPIDFIDALIRTSKSQATDRRDKAFSLLGLAHNGFDYVPLPNYTQSPDDFSLEISTALIKKQKSLQILSYAWDTRRKHRGALPSWSLDWLDLPPRSLTSELLLTSKVQDSKSIYFRGMTSIRKHLVDETTPRFSISGRTLELRGKRVDTIFATSRTYSEVNGEVFSGVDQSTWRAAAESNSEFVLDQSAFFNPYYNHLDCIKALLQTFALYGDCTLKQKIDSVTFEQYTTTTQMLDLDVEDNAPSWLVALLDFKFQNKTFKQWIADFRYVYLNSSSEESISDLFTRRIRIHRIHVPVAQNVMDSIIKELGKVLQLGVRLISAHRLVMLDGHIQRRKKGIRFGFCLDAQSHLFLESIRTAISSLVMFISMGF